MSQVFGYLCSNDGLTSAVIERIGDDVEAMAPAARSGMGLGWIQDGQSLLRKHPQLRAADTRLTQLMTDIPGRAIVGHVRPAALGTAKVEDLQPFRFRHWVWAQSGVTEHLGPATESVQAELPDHILRNIQGTTVAELIFHQFMNRLQQTGAMGMASGPRDPVLYAQALSRTMLEIEVRQALYGINAAKWAVVAATERVLMAARMGAEPLYYKFFEGIEEKPQAPLFAGHRPRPVVHERFRALFVANMLASTEGWTPVPERSLLWVDKSWQVTVVPLEEPTPHR